MYADVEVETTARSSCLDRLVDFEVKVGWMNRCTAVQANR